MSSCQITIFTSVHTKKWHYAKASRASMVLYPLYNLAQPQTLDRLSLRIIFTSSCFVLWESTAIKYRKVAASYLFSIPGNDSLLVNEWEKST